MQQIQLTCGLIAYVDDQDYPVLSKRTWTLRTCRKNQYAVTWIDRKTTFMHRLIMSPPKGLVVDHIDGNGLNNVRSNLRICTQAQNLGNQRKRGRTSRFKGVCRYPSLVTPWQAVITKNYKQFHLGRFETEEAAAAAYDTAARELHGDFARLNAEYQATHPLARGMR